MSDDRHEAGIKAAMKALTAHRTMPGPNMRQDAEDAIAAYKQVAGLVDRESLVAEIVAFIDTAAQNPLAWTGAAQSAFSMLARQVEREFSARPARTPEPPEER